MTVYDHIIVYMYKYMLFFFSVYMFIHRRRRSPSGWQPKKSPRSLLRRVTKQGGGGSPGSGQAYCYALLAAGFVASLLLWVALIRGIRRVDRRNEVRLRCVSRRASAWLNKGWERLKPHPVLVPVRASVVQNEI